MIDGLTGIAVVLVMFLASGTPVHASLLFAHRANPQSCVLAQSAAAPLIAPLIAPLTRLVSPLPQPFLPATLLPTTLLRTRPPPPPALSSPALPPALSRPPSHQPAPALPLALSRHGSHSPGRPHPSPALLSPPWPTTERRCGTQVLALDPTPHLTAPAFRRLQGDVLVVEVHRLEVDLLGS